MPRKPWLLAVILMALAALAAVLLLRPSVSPAPSATPDWRYLPTVTPPGPGEPTVPPEALRMRAAPTATPGTPPTLTPWPTPTPTPTLEPPAPVPPTGSDDVPMVEIPAGEFRMGVPYAETRRCLGDCYQEIGFWDKFLIARFPNESPRLRVYLPTFTIDRFPVTNARYQACVAVGVCRPVEIEDPDLPSDYATNPLYAESPVRGVTWYDANTYCSWVGKRLPTEPEWEKAARGTDGRHYPWGNEWNQEFVTPLLSPVGAHPQGASPYGVEDMISEGGEWTLSPLRPYPGNPGLSGPDAERGNEPAIRGHSSHRRPIWWVTFRFKQDPDFGGKAGFRCVRGPTPPPTLEEALVQIEIPPTPQPAVEVDLSNMVYIPAGPFLMGYSEPYINSRGIDEHADAMPLHVVDLDAFYIDRYEVTYGEYLRFLNAMGGHEFACYGFHCAAIWREGDPDSLGSPIRLEGGEYRVEPELENLPMGDVSWYGAAAYCAWLGKRLPTEAEWEKAARGTDGRPFPWGNEWDPRGETDTLHPRAVGSQDINVSPYGVYDMFGNEVEWVWDWYAPDYYTCSPLYNPTGPDKGERRVRRSLGGGVDSLGRIYFGLPGRSRALPDLPFGGFRCAYSPGQEQRKP